MMHGDPHQRRRGSRRCTEILKREAPPEDRELAPEPRPDPLRGHAGPPRARPAGGGGGRAAPQRTSASSRARCRPATSSTRACPGIHVSVREPQRGRGRAPWAAGAGLPLETHDRRDPHRRPALHLRQPQELPAEGRACACSRRSTRSSRCAASGSGSSAIGAVARRGQQGELLLLPDRAASSRRSGCGGSSTRSSRC